MKKNYSATLKRTTLLWLVAGTAMLGLSVDAYAVPSFARQTGLACDVCHTVFPKLTAFGRLFKLNAYTMTGIKQVAAKNSPAHAGLSIDQIPPLSAMLQIGITQTAKAAPGSQRETAEFPGPLSLYYAGEINPHTGAFIQVTMDDASSNFGFDMADVRHTFDRATIGGKSLTYGISVNNGPGMADLWNGTPAWTFPYQGSGTAPTPSADPAVNMMVMGSGVAGLSAYALYGGHWYANLGGYYSTASTADPGTIENLAPYWRLAWQNTFDNGGYLEVGAYGIVAKPRQGWMGMGAPGLTDRYSDTALDMQYERGMADKVNLHAIYIHEKRRLDSTYAAGMSSNDQDTLKQLRMDASYIVDGRYQYTLGYFKTSGTSDKMLYNDSVTGSPNSSGAIAEVDFLPWQNTKLTLQYTMYSKFDGGSHYYVQPSVLRSASDNNTLFLNAWFMW